jgi:hypothetical protein
LGGFFLFLACTDSENPFENSAHADFLITVQSVMQPGDTLALYTTTQLECAPALPGFIDSVYLQCSANRLWQDTLLYPQGPQAFTLPISVYDTGWQTVPVSIWLTTGNRLEKTWHFYARSLLYQADISALIDSAIRLETPAVSDSVWYHWRYGSQITDTLHSRTAQYDQKFNRPDTFTGYLWVSQDPTGSQYPTPPQSFSVSIRDEIAPFIVCTNQYTSGDTIFAGSDPFELRLHISDAGGVLLTTVNGLNADVQQYPRVRKSLYGISAYSTDPLP